MTVTQMWLLLIAAGVAGHAILTTWLLRGRP